MDRDRYKRPDKIIIYLYRRLGNDRIEYLLLQRNRDARSGAIWQPVVGNARWNENLVEAARREVFEETGLTRLQGVMAVGYAFSFVLDWPQSASRYAPGVDKIRNTVFAAQVVSNKPIQLSGEHVDFGWFEYGEAMQRIHWLEEQEGLRRLHPMLVSRKQVL
jgi:8-oxo-dGTP pyrophosphatase MutT (NUDIX family)